LWADTIYAMGEGDELGFVLVAGAGLGTWAWDRVALELERPVLPVAIPGRNLTGRKLRRFTLAAAADEVAKLARAWTEPERIVVVGHSLAGVLVPALASRLAGRAAAVVFVGALAPRHGQRALELMSGQSRFFVRLFRLLRPGGMKPPASALRNELCNDLDVATAALVVERFEPVPEAPRLYRDPVSWAGVPAVPRLYVQLLRDRSVAPDEQERMAAAIGAELATLDSGHLPMLSRPDELAAELDRVAAAA
jgi:pimeloyl-ACP methyl ester carboxylesterase